MPADLILGGDPPHGRGETLVSLALLLRAWIPLRGSSLIALSNPNHLPDTWPPDITMLEGRALTHELWDTLSP